MHLANSKVYPNLKASNLLSNETNQVRGTALIQELNSGGKLSCRMKEYGKVGWSIAGILAVYGLVSTYRTHKANKQLKSLRAETETKSEITEKLDADYEDENTRVSSCYDSFSPSVYTARFIISPHIYESLQERLRYNQLENFFIRYVMSNCQIAENVYRNNLTQMLLENGIPYACLSSSSFETELENLLLKEQHIDYPEIF